MKYRVLGPLEILVSGEPLVLGAAKERALVAALLARVNEVVTVDDLFEVLWGESPPRTAGKTLQTYVSQLRRVLGPDERIETRPRGYALRAQPGEVDAGVFEQLVGEGRAALAVGDAHRASNLLAEGLAVWRGRAYEEVADRGFLAGEAVRLEEQRLGALEDRIEADIAQGRHRTIIGELEAAVGEHPLRERFWGQLMVVLYRSGRQADALQAFQRARRVLIEELGIEPGPQLKRLETAILGQDAELDGPSSAPAAVDRPPTTSYARCGDAHIAYQVVGDGQPDILFVNDWYSHVEVIWEHPVPAAFVQQLSTVGRLVLFDGRGTGLSDPVDRNDPPTFEQWIEDACAVLDDIGIEKVTLFGSSAGAAMCLVFAATLPERVEAVVLMNPILAFRDSRPAEIGFEATLSLFLKNWGREPALQEAGPSVLREPSLLAWFGRYQRMSASPGAMAGRFRMVFGIDVRGIATRIQIPTLVLHRRGNRIAPIDTLRPVVDAMPHGTMVELAGDDHMWFAGDDGAEIAANLRRFLDRTDAEAEPEGVLVTLVAVQLLPPAGAERRRRHDEAVTRQVERHDGRQIGSTNGSSLYLFTGPARAIRCASGLLDVVRRLGGEARAGVHTGETQPGKESTSIAAGVASEVSGVAAPGEVWVSRTVVDLVAGSGLQFTTRGDHHLSLTGERWNLFAVD